MTTLPFLLWQKCRIEPDDLSRTRMTFLPFLLLALSPFVIFDSDNPLISCPLCKSKTLWNIFMILCRNVEQDQTLCHVLEWQLYLSYFWRYLTLLYLTDYPLILCPLCKSKTLWNIFVILDRNVVEDQMMCRIQEWQLWLSYFWSSPFVLFKIDFSSAL